MTKENKQTDDTVYVYNTISVDNMYIPKPRNKNKKKPLLQKKTKLTSITNFTKKQEFTTVKWIQAKNHTYIKTKRTREQKKHKTKNLDQKKSKKKEPQQTNLDQKKYKSKKKRTTLDQKKKNKTILNQHLVITAIIELETQKKYI